ncbi:MAG: GGDEF domain-containing response regulator [Holosporaceae bacterium]|jgi:diguanylate cyclase (GGDEF)-like protein|nr:GGDEF domain-containing response regulator [Holosporaceae bacterium]
MVARILIINEDGLNVSRISSSLQESYCSLLFARSLEDSLRIIRTQSVDAVFLSLPKNISGKSSGLFFDFFSVLRQLCGVIPIIGLTESEQNIPPLRLEDILSSDTDREDLLRRINVPIKMKNMFDENLIGNMYLDEGETRKIVTFFHDNVDFLHESILENIEIVMLRTWPVADNISDSDLFIINVNHTQANECCASLRLRKTNRYKPIVLTFDAGGRDKAKLAVKADIGYTDIMGTEDNPLITKNRLYSLIRYKKLYDVFAKKLKRSLYISTIDSITEVYNRSYFEDYLKNKERCPSSSAVIMLDIDKFKLINDKFGHSFADSVLRHVSGMIKKYIRSSDVVARYGGDEFVILMNDVTKSVAEEVSHRIQKKIEDSSFYNAHCTVSIGVCCIEPGGNISLHDAISIADKFMYLAKHGGGNSVKICA